MKNASVCYFFNRVAQVMEKGHDFSLFPGNSKESIVKCTLLAEFSLTLDFYFMLQRAVVEVCQSAQSWAVQS